MGRNKTVLCQICYHVMRSDYLKTHTKVHQKRGETKKNVDKKRMIQKLIKASDEYTIGFRSSLNKYIGFSEFTGII